MKFVSLFRQKVNKKIHPGVWIAPNRTFYVTFLISALFHLGVIYAVPSVKIFSEGPGAESPEFIEVALVQEEVAVEASDIPLQAENQFLATAPPEESAILEETETEEPSPAPTMAATEHDLALPLQESREELKEEFALITNSVSRDPGLTNLSKRSAPQEPPESRPSPTTPQEITKRPPTHRLTPPPVTIPRPVDTTETPRIAPVRTTQPEATPRTDDLPALSRPSLDKRTRPQERFETTLQHQPKLLPEKRLASSTQRFGISADDEYDQNRFGIFAGKLFKTPVIPEDRTRPTIPEMDEEQALANTSETKETAETPDTLQIEGPLKGRRIVEQPPPPQIDVDIDVDLQLKFWVLPDGTIGEVVPLKRGDVRLERIAISYLKQWKFEALPPDVPQQQIWGTIPIKFTLQ